MRDRESYEFALASAVVALDLDDGRIREARIALGGVATVPWRATAAESALKGKAINDAAKKAAADAAFASAQSHEHNAFKVELGKHKGKIVVEFASLDDLQRIVTTMSPDWAQTLPA